MKIIITLIVVLSSIGVNAQRALYQIIRTYEYNDQLNKWEAPTEINGKSYILMDTENALFSLKGGETYNWTLTKYVGKELEGDYSVFTWSALGPRSLNYIECYIMSYLPNGNVDESPLLFKVAIPELGTTLYEVKVVP